LNEEELNLKLVEGDLNPNPQRGVPIVGQALLASKNQLENKFIH